MYDPLIDKIMRSPLLKMALRSDQPKSGDRVMTPELLRYLLETTQRLASNVQFSEFTEHGLPHVESLVNRISNWTISKTPSGEQQYLVDDLHPNEAALLSFGVLTHDLGMLSQRPEDLPPARRYVMAPQFADLSAWVRRTHGERLPGLIDHLLASNRELLPISKSLFVRTGVALAMTHQEWPESNWPAKAGPVYSEFRQKANDYGLDLGRAAGLAAILAVADLLDEDYRRCDAEALLGHKQATTLNRAHWLRHYLVSDPPSVNSGKVVIRLGMLERWVKQLEATVIVLKFHLRQAERRYNSLLHNLGADIELVFENVAVPSNALNGKLDYFDLAPDIHLLRAFDTQAIEAVLDGGDTESGHDEESGLSDQVRDKLRFVRDILPSDHDAIITLRAAKTLSGEESVLESARKIVRRDILIALQQGHLMLAEKLNRDYKYEL